MEIFINESSLTGQYFSEAEFADAVKTFVSIFVKVNEKRLTAYKNSTVLLHRKALLESVFQASFEKLRDKSLKLAFGQIVFNRSNPKDWTAEQLHQLHDFFYCPILDDTVEGTVLAEVAERNLQDAHQKRRLLINFKASPFIDSPIVIFKNDEELENPIPLDCVDNQEDFEKWVDLIPYDPETFLKNDQVFQRLKMQYDGKTIYKHIATGQYWYLDNFHKQKQGARHFEVFDATGKKHLGEADLNGLMNTEKADDSKKLTL